MGFKGLGLQGFRVLGLGESRQAAPTLSRKPERQQTMKHDKLSGS